MATHVISRADAPYAVPPAANAREDDIDIPTLVSTLTDNKWPILFGTLAFFIVAVAYVLLATPQYEANAVVQVESRPPTVPGLNQPTTAPAPPVVDAPAATETQLLTSRRVLGEAIERLDLDTVVEPVRMPLLGDMVSRMQQRLHPGEVASPWFGLNSYAWGGEQVDIGQFEVPDQLVGMPLQLIAGERGRYKVLDPDGNLMLEGRVGQKATNGRGLTLEIERLAANAGTRFDLTRLNTMALMTKLKKDITVSEQGRNSGIINLTYSHPDPLRAKQVLDQITQAYVRQNVARNSAEAAKRLQFVTEQLPKVRRELADAQARLNTFQSRTRTMDVGVSNKALLDQTVALDQSIQQLQVQRADIASRYTPEHPVYQSLMRQIGQFESKKNQIMSQIGNLPDTQQGLFRLNRDVEVINQTYANLLDQAQQLNIAAASAVGNARVIDPADVNMDSPSWPKPLIVIGAGTLIGAMFMVAFVLTRQMFRRGVEDPVDIELLGLPVYASIPFSAKGKQIVAQPGTAARRDGKQRLLAFRSPSDLAMEALRTLRTSLHFARFEMKNNMLMIAAPSPGVGKSFVCANLAVTMAQAGQRVLLVDADMRRGTLHLALGTRADGGLSELISGRIDEIQAVRKVGGTENLSFITRGTIPPNPSELLMHPRFTALLDKLAQQYDIVVIDTPPVLAVTDAAVIGHHVGTCLMVVRWGLNQQREIALAKQRLEQNGVEVRGAIFNAVQKRGSGQYAYTYYDYQPMKDEPLKAAAR
ncbi:polysaccharide biosynthesis tyrosine autokinase [Lysobacter auxotrophicus]|uniref:Polysaccharide biosynthesis tyrosine autokinase n=1 Tax=Lysobacter auxotrophicus TaxID=2992573 RepID=A0ABM8DER3_9GAMM|nr:polysaccharide biosynthesis tyrosine autokinase [Lysobacter auxotrophicus]BDU17051.1 polysaccharide biosynthesis tyrosine autokinase [Lysobacter auxotrophicus]